jgi:hypothetical protein
MIQRRQSLWLILAALGGFISYILPFFSGASTFINNIKPASLYASSTFVLMVLTGASILLSLVTIFLYKDRKLQLRMCFAGVALSVLVIVLYFMEMKKLSGSISLWAIFVFLIPISYIMAARGIQRDEKLIKSLDKLR